MAAAAPLSPEPMTPLWLTCLGGGLFLLVGLVLVFRSPPLPKPAKEPVTVAAVAPAAPARPAQGNAAPPRAGQGAAPPGAQGAGLKMDPDALKRMNERLRQAAPGGQPGGQPAPGGH